MYSFLCSIFSKPLNILSLHFGTILVEEYWEAINCWISKIEVKSIFVNNSLHANKYIPYVLYKSKAETVLLFGCDFASPPKDITKSIVYLNRYNNVNTKNIFSVSNLVGFGIGEIHQNQDLSFIHYLLEKKEVRSLQLPSSPILVKYIDKIVQLPNLIKYDVSSQDVNMEEFGNKFTEAIKNDNCKIEIFHVSLNVLKKIWQSFNVFVLTIYLRMQNYIFPKHLNLIDTMQIGEQDKETLRLVCNKLKYNREQKSRREASLLYLSCLKLKSIGLEYKDIKEIIDDSKIEEIFNSKRKWP